jgi:D-ribose pyranose/furanose isomerase RbsD
MLDFGKGGNSMIKISFDLAVGVLLLGLISACGQTGVRDIRRVADLNLPRPNRVLIYDFAVSEQEVREYQGIMRQQPAIKDAATRERLLAQEVKDALAEQLVERLTPLGFVVERVARGTAATENDLVVDGQFLTVDEGSPFKRLVVGFGTGASAVQSRVKLYQGPDTRKLLEFTTQSDSGKMPGVAPTMGAGAAAQGGVTAGMVAVNATVSGVRNYRSEVARMGAASGDQVSRYLSEFFARQNWIRADQVRKARMVY